MLLWKNGRRNKKKNSAPDRIRTCTAKWPRDFKSLVSQLVTDFHLKHCFN